MIELKKYKTSEFLSLLNISKKIWDTRKEDLLEHLKLYFDYEIIVEGRNRNFIIKKQYAEYEPLPRKRKQKILPVVKPKSVKPKGGIYCFRRKDNNEIIYIGMTTRDFEKRKKEHMNYLKNGKSNMKLYRKLKAFQTIGVEVEFEPLISICDLKVSEKITTRDLKAMELALITLYKPIGNTKGTDIDYTFD